MLRLWVLRNKVRALFGLAPVPMRDRDVPPVPRVLVHMGWTLPGVLVRLLPGVLALVVAWFAGCVGPWWVLAWVAAVWLVVQPLPQVTAGYLGVAAIWLLADGNRLVVDPVSGAVPGVWSLSGLVLTVHLLAVVAAVAGHVGWTALVEAAVLGRALRSAGAAQAVAQSALLLVAWVRAGTVGQLELLRGVAMVAVVAAVVLLVPREWPLVRRLRRERDRTGP